MKLPQFTIRRLTVTMAIFGMLLAACFFLAPRSEDEWFQWSYVLVVMGFSCCGISPILGLLLLGWGILGRGDRRPPD